MLRVMATLTPAQCREARHRLNMTQGQLAKVSMVPYFVISQFEKGRLRLGPFYEQHLIEILHARPGRPDT